MKHQFQRLARALARALTRHAEPRSPEPGRQPPFDFDALAKELAQGLSRREALRRLGAGLAGAALAGLGLATGASATPSPCNSYCKACTGTAKRQCTDACLACAANPNNLCGPCGAKVCKNLASDLNNCGQCGNVCPTLPHSSPTCVNGQCGFTCNQGYSTCGSVSTASGCAINLTNDVGNCGACGNVCPIPPNTVPTCTNSACGAVCLAGYADCNGSSTDGCEVSLLTDTSNCGACGRKCPYGESCVNGHCTCGTSGADCPGGELCCNGICRNALADISNCGSCGNTCTVTPNTNAIPVCNNGVCGAVCTAPYADCNGLASDGCETNTSTDVNNCGGCGNVCSFPHGLATCIGGGCQLAGCLSGYANCDGLPGNGCETNLLTDAANCGNCGIACLPGQSCSNGFCTCPSGLTNCSQTCVDLQSDSNHCGLCTTSCATGKTCSNGICCDTGQTGCSGACTNTQTDFYNCGACGNICPAGGSCMSGKCVCPTGQDACNGTCVNRQTDNNNCGTCGSKCGAGASCSSGICCQSGLTNCGSACVSLQIDQQNCGSCGNQCGSGTYCTNGHCCDFGQMYCGGACVNTQTDVNDCGGCGVVCQAGPNSTAVCINGRCNLTCNPGYGNCDGNPATGCETNLNADANNCGACNNVCLSGTTCCNQQCVNKQTDASNCGACGNVCTGGQICSSGQCTCPSGLVNCSGKCVDVLSDPNNCHTCGQACQSGYICSDGNCCPNGQTACNAVCKDLKSDQNNCGACGYVCPSVTIPGPLGGTQTIQQGCSGGICCGLGATNCGGTCVQLGTDTHCSSCSDDCTAQNIFGTDFRCCGGQCFDTMANASNCGTCGNLCALGGVCIAGACVLPF